MNGKIRLGVDRMWFDSAKVLVLSRWGGGGG